MERRGGRRRGEKGILMFGKPLVGKPIAAEHIRALPMTRRLGWGSGMAAPTVWTSGRMMSAATVWEMKVATTRMRAEKTMRTE